MRLKKIALTVMGLLLCALVLTLVTPATGAGVQVAHADEQSNKDFAQSVKNNDICNDINDKMGGILSCGSKDVTSFIGFQGGLNAPSGDGLDQTLTRAKTAREFIVNIVNFVLTFLGVLAMAIVIYGGFLYVTAAGNEENSTKGKKAISYAVIGILIIIGSYALVNTLLSAGGGTGTGANGASGNGVDAVRNAGEEGSNIGQQAIYSLGASEINGSLNDFVGAYKNLVTMQGIIKQVKNLPQPGPRTDNISYLNAVTSLVEQIKNGSNSLSKTNLAARKILEGWISQTRGQDLLAEGFEDGAIKGQFEEQLPDLEKATKDDYNAAITSLIGPEGKAPTTRPDKSDVEGRLPVVWKVMGAVADLGANEEASRALQRGLLSEKDMQRAFEGIDPNITVGELFKDAVGQLDKARSLKDNPDQPDLILKAVKALDRLHVIVKDIQFVYVKVKASMKEGSAPLIVELNGLDSRDPTSQTIGDEKYQWDPDGDGANGLSKAENGFAAVECNAITGPTITCTYSQPGTYLVRLSIQSKDPARVASGEAYLAITVGPSVARIGLKATMGSITEELRKYEQDAHGQWSLSLDKSEFHVTTQEATTSGVDFDASSSTDGSGDAIKNFKWTYGDSSAPEEGPDKAKITGHKYPREGKFPLLLEVTDRGGRKDRKLVNIVVASIAARIATNVDIGEPDQLIEFDGSLSRSDHGSISAYAWSVVDDKTGEDIINFKNDLDVIGTQNGSVLRLKFKKPGSFSVKLNVSDGSKTDETKVTIAVKSRKPRANFVVASCPSSCVDPSQPSLVELDASLSFDPDKGDVLTYDWSFFSDLGEKLEENIGFKVIKDRPDGPDIPLVGQQSKKIRVKFFAVGKVKAVLKVNDSHPDPNIIQEDTKEKVVDIVSVVEAKWDPSFNPVTKMEAGKAHFDMKGTVLNATQVQIDFGDGETNQQTITPDKNNVGTFDFPKDYKKAGSFLVTLKAISEEGGHGTNTIARRMYAAQGDAPFAIMNVMMDNNEVVLPDAPADAAPGTAVPALDTIRNKIIKFDASSSLNSKGKTDGLSYSWDFGDQKRTTGPKTEHSYGDISVDGAPFMVTLTVTENDDPTKTNQTTFPIRIVSKKPTINTLSLEKKTAGEVTPVDVEVTAENASDEDGHITNFQFWYYDPAAKDQKLSVIDTQENHATLTVETSGEENEEHEYYFCVSATDNENTTSECSDLFSENELPKVKVKNGANKAPVVDFAADRTSIKVGDPVIFTSSSTDPDDRIAQYVWDVEGDGFQNDNPTELSTITQTYTKRSPPGGYRVKLKAIDDKNAAGYSKEVPIYVLTNSNPPLANFTYQVDPLSPRRVKFIDTSTADPKSGAKITKWKWDFDTSQEFGCDKDPKPKSCNGNKTDDEDSTDQNPIFEYTAGGSYQVKLTATDSDGNDSDPKTAVVTVIAGASGGTQGTKPVSNVLKAELKTDPPYKFETVGDKKKKVLHLPAHANGEQISLSWSESTGDIIKYKIDKNVWCDSDGNSNRSDDTDNPDTVSGTCSLASNGTSAEKCWTTNYQRYARTGHPQGAGNFTTLLTVISRDGTTDTDSVDVVFDGTTDPAKVSDKCNGQAASMLGASFFAELGVQKSILLLGGITVILIFIIAGVANLLRRGKSRDII